MRNSEKLESMLSPGQSLPMGEVLLSRCAESGNFKAVHQKDRETSIEMLKELETAAEVREMTKLCEQGKHRPLKTAPGLKSGWFISQPDAESFLLFLDEIYPACFATTIHYFDDQIEPVPLRKTLERQSGMNEGAKDITANQANQILRDTCAQGCLRKVAWPLDDSCPVSRLRMSERRISLVCTEACSIFVSEAQRR